MSLSVRAPAYTVAQAFPTYVPGHEADVHWELLRRSLCRSVLLTEELVDNGVSPHPQTYWLVRAPVRPGPLDWVRRGQRRLAARSRQTRLESFIGGKLAEHAADILHIHFGTFAVKLLPLLDRVRLPVVVTLYGVDASAALREPATLAAYRRLYPRVGRMIVLSEIVRERLEATGCSPDRITVWDMPLDFRPYPYHEPRPGPTVKLLTAARFVEKKGYPTLLRAVALLKGRGLPVSLTAIGYGPLKDSIRDMARQLGLEAHVTIVDTSAHRGFSSLYSCALAAHDIFVLPSTVARNGDDEGGPALTLVMAQAAGLPVVCTRFTGSERSVIDGETGLFCRPDDPEALAERLSFLISRPHLWRSLGEAGSRFVRERFNKDRQIDALAAIYGSLLR